MTRDMEPRLAREMAGDDSLAIYRSAGSKYAPEDPHPSVILATRSFKSNRMLRLGELYDEMLMDADLAAIVLKVKDAVMSLPREIVPAVNTPEAQEVADFCHGALSEIEDFAINLEHQCDALAKGIAFDEIMWERQGNTFVPVAIVDRPMHRFGFRFGKLFVRQSGKDIEAPDGKFLVHRYGTKDSPWGRALLDQVYWAWFMKKHGQVFYAHYVEKYAAPTAVAKYKRSRTGNDVQVANQREQAAAANLARAFQGNSAMAIPADIELELIEATMSGNANYGEFLSLCTRSMALLFLGEINTSGLRPGVGAYASDVQANELRKEKIVLMARKLGSHVRDHLLRPMAQLNFGPNAPVPRMVFDDLDVEGLEARRQGVTMLLEAGEPVATDEFYRIARIRRPRKGEDVVIKKADVGTPAPASGEEPESAAVAPLPAAAGSGVVEREAA